MLLATLLLAAPPGAAETRPPTQTVCTITVSSADEKETFRRYLPAAKYRFVELVERDRPDWLAPACRAAIACDVLIISGHYDGHDEFFSDRLEVRDFLRVDELERVSCSESCSGLFSQLKEVYLFGCNTLNPLPLSSATAEVVRSLVREGVSPRQAEQQLRALNAGHGESSRDRMRLVFKDVPVIYGFSSVAPLGPIAAAALGGYFRTNGAGEVGLGRASSQLLGQFRPYGMAATQGMTKRDAHADVRSDVCHFADDRLSDADKLAFVRQLLQRQMPDVRVYLDRIQRTLSALDEPGRRSPEVTEALDAIAGDTAARTRFLDFARDADQPVVRARMLKLAADLGWLSAGQRRHELALMLAELQARSTLGAPEVDLACTLNQHRDLDGVFDRRSPPDGAAEALAHAAFSACLGSSEGHARTLAGLATPNEADVRIAQSYLRQRPITDAAELRRVAEDIGRMPASPAQVRALETLGRHYVADREILDMLVRLFAQTPSAPVQAAIAGILIRADRRSIASPQLLRTLIERRRPSQPADGMVDALIRQLRAA